MRRLALIALTGTLLIGLAAFVAPRISDRLLTSAPPEAATPTDCQAAKLKAAGKFGGAVLGCYAKVAKAGTALDSACTGKARDTFLRTFATLESNMACLTTSDAAVVSARLDMFIHNAVGALPFAAASEKCTGAKLKATGKLVSSLLKAYGKNEKTADAAKLDSMLSTANALFHKQFMKADALAAASEINCPGSSAQVALLVHELLRDFLGLLCSTCRSSTLQVSTSGDVVTVESQAELMIEQEPERVTLYNPSELSDAEEGSLSPPELSVGILPNPAALSLADFVANLSDGWYLSYQEVTELTFTGRQAILANDLRAGEGALVPPLALFVRFPNSILVVTGRQSSIAEFFEIAASVNLVE